MALLLPVCWACLRWLQHGRWGISLEQAASLTKWELQHWVSSFAWPTVAEHQLGDSGSLSTGGPLKCQHPPLIRNLIMVWLALGSSLRVALLGGLGGSVGLFGYGSGLLSGSTQSLPFPSYPKEAVVPSCADVLG